MDSTFTLQILLSFALRKEDTVAKLSAIGEGWGSVVGPEKRLKGHARLTHRSSRLNNLSLSLQTFH